MSTPPRRWFAFRLSTLVLAVWTIAVGGLVWQRWDSWHLVLTIPWHSSYGFDDVRRTLVVCDPPGGTLSVWNLSELRCISRFTTRRSNAQLVDVELFPGEKSLATLDSDGIIRIWNLAGEQQGRFECAGERIEAPRRKFISVESKDARGRLVVKAVNLNTGKVVICPLATRDYSISFDGRFMIERYDRNAVFDCESELWLEIDGDVTTADFAPDRNELAFFKGAVPVRWDLEAHRKIAEFSPHSIPCDHGEHDPQLRYTNDGSYLHTNSPYDFNRQVKWQVATGAISPLGARDFLEDLSDWVAPDNREVDGHEMAIRHRGTQFTDLFKFKHEKRSFLSFVPMPELGTRVLTFDATSAYIYDRRFPEWWWGHFYRPEVWAGIVLAGIWLLKLWRRIFHRTAAA